METGQNKKVLERINESISKSVTFKLLSIGILILILLIPQSMITSLIGEREQRMQSTIQEVTEKWSRSQTITGPSLVIPYKRFIMLEDDKGVKTVIRYATFLPDELNVSSTIEPEERYRGIFKVIVYKSDLEIEGGFPKPDFSQWDVRDEDILWNKAVLNLGISDLRGIEQQVELSIGKTKLPFSPGVDTNSITKSGIHLALGEKVHNLYNSSSEIKIKLKGSERLFFIPLGKTTKVAMKSAWKDPSFSGSFLPKERNIRADGFDASWQILHFNRNYPQKWTDKQYYLTEQVNYNLYGDLPNYAVNKNDNNLDYSKFGVNLLVTADHYQKSLRTSKYSILIIALTFLMFFLIEITAKLRIHAFQYILIGLALIIFYTLLLSISEHIGYNLAYGLSAIAIVGLISMYAFSVLKNRKFGLLLAGSLSMIYGFIFIIIQIESYALLVGSIGLFAILALTMFFTRKINWYNAKS